MFLATQVPLKETVEYFWRMVWENNSHAIVMLYLAEEGEENCNRKKVLCVHQIQDIQITYFQVIHVWGPGVDELSVLAKQSERQENIWNL